MPGYHDPLQQLECRFGDDGEDGSRGGDANTGLLHVVVEKRDDSLRIPTEVVVAIPEAFGGILDPEQFIVLACQQIEHRVRAVSPVRTAICNL